MYNYNKEKEEFAKTKKHEGEKNTETRQFIDCNICEIKELPKVYTRKGKIESEKSKIEITNEKQENKNRLLLIPLSEEYCDYMLESLLRLPKSRVFIGRNYGDSMFKLLNDVFLFNEITKEKRFELICQIDGRLNYQRSCLRIIRKNGWVETKKCEVAMNKINEIGRIIGGLKKRLSNQESAYGKNN